jgi:hypothetical protein
MGEKLDHLCNEDCNCSMLESIKKWVDNEKLDHLCNEDCNCMLEAIKKWMDNEKLEHPCEEDCNCMLEAIKKWMDNEKLESIALIEKRVNKLESDVRKRRENFPGSVADTAGKLELLCIEDCKLSMAERYALLEKRLTKLDSEVRNHREQLQSLCIENLPGSGADTAEREKLSMI